MILKVWNENTNRWCLIDNIMSIEKGFAFMVKEGLKGQVSTVSCKWQKDPQTPDKVKKGEAQSDCFYPDYDFVPVKTVMEIADGKQKSAKVCAAVMEMRDKTTAIAVCGTLAYILNDDGKTLEKL